MPPAPALAPSLFEDIPPLPADIPPLFEDIPLLFEDIPPLLAEMPPLLEAVPLPDAKPPLPAFVALAGPVVLVLEPPLEGSAPDVALALGLSDEVLQLTSRAGNNRQARVVLHIRHSAYQRRGQHARR